MNSSCDGHPASPCSAPPAVPRLGRAGRRTAPVDAKWVARAGVVVRNPTDTPGTGGVSVGFLRSAGETRRVGHLHGIATRKGGAALECDPWGARCCVHGSMC
ncbi:hypothetical protein GCM10027062_40330 [Nocardioides hungaricus]